MSITEWPQGLKPGQFFGDVQLVQYLGRRNGGDHVFRVACKCGEFFPALLTDLRNGKVTDCGIALNRVCSLKREQAARPAEDDLLRKQMREDMRKRLEQFDVFGRTR
jgi:hypothetical protein